MSQAARGGGSYGGAGGAGAEVGGDGSWMGGAGARQKTARNGSALGTMGLAIAANGDGERSMPLGANAPRVSTAAIVSAGGTVRQLIESLLESVRVGTMDVRERAAAAS